MFWNQNWLNSSVLNPTGTFERGFCLVSFNFYTNTQQMFSFISCVISPTLHILVYCFWQWWKTGISWPFVFWVLHKLSCSFREYFLFLSCSRFLIWKAALEIPGAVQSFWNYSLNFVLVYMRQELVHAKERWSFCWAWRFVGVVTSALTKRYCVSVTLLFTWKLSLIVVWGRQKSRTIELRDGDNPIKLCSLYLYECRIDLYSNLGVLSSLLFASYCSYCIT